MGGGGVTVRGIKKRRGGNGALKVSPSEYVVDLFTIEVTLDQALGNGYHFNKPIHRIKNFLAVK